MQAAKFDHGDETVLLSEDILRSVAVEYSRKAEQEALTFACLTLGGSQDDFGCSEYNCWSQE